MFFANFVSVPPNIDIQSASNSNLSVILDSMLIIDCPVTGIPLPQISWFKNLEFINPSIDPNLKLYAGGRRLEIKNARISDAAIYRCVGKNVAGNTYRDYTVDVYGNFILIACLC